MSAPDLVEQLQGVAGFVFGALAAIAREQHEQFRKCARLQRGVDDTPVGGVGQHGPQRGRRVLCGNIRNPKQRPYDGRDGQGMA